MRTRGLKGHFRTFKPIFMKKPQNKKKLGFKLTTKNSPQDEQIISVLIFDFQNFLFQIVSKMKYDTDEEPYYMISICFKLILCRP